MMKVLITGSTGMIGKGVLLECIINQDISEVVLINRSSIDIQNEKIKELLLKDFSDLASLKEQIGPVDGCFHCMGVSSVGLSEEQYSKLTFGISKSLADVCFELNPAMTFNYVSGTGTDSSEKGRSMWARVKGKTENYILGKGFQKSYMFRPGFIIPENGIKSRTKLYNRIYTVMRPFFPMFKKMKGVTTTTKIGQTMLITLFDDKQGPIYLENREINELAAPE